MMLSKVVVYVIAESGPQLTYDTHQAPTADQSAQLTSTHFQMHLFAVLKNLLTSCITATVVHRTVLMYGSTQV